MTASRLCRVAGMVVAALLIARSSAIAQCTCSISIEPIPSLQNLTIVPGTSTTADLFIDNDGTITCTYDWSIAQTSGPVASLSPRSGQLVVGRFGSARVPITVRIPADVVASEAVQIFATATTSGAKCQAQHWVNIVPSDELTVSQAWLDANPTVHIFGQRLQPSTALFSGRTVYPATPLPMEGFDTCHRAGDPFSPYTGEIKAPLRVGLFNEFGDVVGYTKDVVEYFRRNTRVPCGAEFKQYMGINCTIINPCLYTTNTLKASLPDGLTVYVERDGVGVSRTWPPLGPTLPGPPTNFTVNVNGLAVTLSWFAPTGSVISSYRIEAGTIPAAWNLADFDIGSAATTFSASGVPPGTYFARVRAVNAVGRSAPSNEVMFTVGGGPTGPPDPPGGSTAVVNDRTVVLNWTAPSGGPPATTYVIEAGSSPGASNLANFATGTLATSFTAPNIPPGTYFIRLRARNAIGTSAPTPDATVVVAAPAVPGAPTGLQAQVSGRNVTLTWTAPAAGGAVAGYLVEAGSTPGTANLASLPTGQTATLTAAAPPGIYYVRVRAVNSAGIGAASNEVIVTVP